MYQSHSRINFYDILLIFLNNQIFNYKKNKTTWLFIFRFFLTKCNKCDIKKQRFLLYDIGNILSFNNYNIKS